MLLNSATGSLATPMNAVAHFNYQRSTKDKWWKYAFFLLQLVVVVWGFVAVGSRNKDFSKLVSEESLYNPAMCAKGRRNALTDDGGDWEEGFPVDEFFPRLFIFLGVTLVGSIILGFVKVYLFRTRPHDMIRWAFYFQTGMLAVMAIFSFAGGSFFGGVMFAMMAALTYYLLKYWTVQLDLTARLFGVSAKGLGDNRSILPFVILLKVGLAALCIPLVAFVFAAYQNGSLHKVDDILILGGKCYKDSKESDESTREIPCCRWEPEDWFPLYAGLASLALLWLVMTAGMVRVYTISGTIAQWYFAPAGSVAYTGNLLRSFKHALGPSFGSLCEGGAIMSAVQALRNMAQRRPGERENIFQCMLRVALDCVLSIIEFLTRFATIRISITGEAFWEGGKSATLLLRRNMLSTAGIWWVPNFVLSSLCFAVSLCWAFFVAIVVKISYRKERSAWAQGAMIGMMVFVLTFAILMFFAAVLHNVIEAAYFCYALDKDAQAITNQDVHNIFQAMPGQPNRASFQDLESANLVSGPAPGGYPGQQHYAPPAQAQGYPVQHVQQQSPMVVHGTPYPMQAPGPYPVQAPPANLYPAVGTPVQGYPAAQGGPSTREEGQGGNSNAKMF